MRLLVTNDDGIESEGIQVLARHLDAAGHEVLLVAPDRNFSGSGAALGDLQLDAGLPAERVAIDGLAHLETWAMAGPPALTVVAAALGAFGPAPDLVVSGINAGLNTGRSILHSGTVGAALTGQNFGLSGLAVSLEDGGDGGDWAWDTAAILATCLLDQVADGPPRSVVNLNVPARRLADVEGIRWARLAPFGAVRAAVATHVDGQVQFEFTAGHGPDPDTDQGTVQEGWAAITTLVGVAEAWPATTRVREPGEGLDADAEVIAHLAPGAPLEPVHVVPGGDDEAALRLVRPIIGTID